MAGVLGVAAVLVGLAPGPRAAGDAGPAAQVGSGADDAALVAEGRSLYLTGCVSCHGRDGTGQDAPDGSVRGPSLVEAGEAGAHYQLTTGRMPLANSDDAPVRKPPAYTPEEIEALVAYVSSLGEGPALPAIDPGAGDLSRGGSLYREHCQACHSSTGAGGALSYGRAAPPLSEATPSQVAAAMRSGPGPMPRFGPELLDDDQVQHVARYVDYLEAPDDRGGLALGRLGPIPEGFMVWVGALGLLLVVAFFVGTRRSAAREVDPEPPPDDEPDADEPSLVSTQPAAVTPEPPDDPPTAREEDE